MLRLLFGSFQRSCPPLELLPQQRLRYQQVLSQTNDLKEKETQRNTEVRHTM